MCLLTGLLTFWMELELELATEMVNGNLDNGSDSGEQRVLLADITMEKRSREASYCLHAYILLSGLGTNLRITIDRKRFERVYAGSCRVLRIRITNHTCPLTLQWRRDLSRLNAMSV